MRRFGVSIPDDIAEKLDELAKILGVTRSEIVREALKVYLGDHRHLSVKHECCGLITAVTVGVKNLNAVEDFKDVIRSFSHVHVGGYCVNSLIVHGDSERIAMLHRELLKVSDFVRFVPLGCNVF